MPKELTLSTCIFYEYSLPYVLRKASEYGFHTLEIAGEEHTDALLEGKYDIAVIGELLEKFDLKVASLHTGKGTEINKANLTAEEKAYYETLFNVARLLKCSVIVDHIDFMKYKRAKQKTLGGLSWLVEMFASGGVTYTIENMAGISPVASADILKNISGLMFTLDIYHALGKGYSPTSYFEQLHNRIVNLHLLGFNPTLSKCLGHGTPPGIDTLDWKRFAKTLTQYNYNGLMTIEIYTESFTQAILPYLMVMEKVLNKKTELSIVPLRMWFMRKLPQPLLDLDIEKIKLVYDPGGSTPDLSLNHIITIYAKEFFEKNLLGSIDNQS